MVAGLEVGQAGRATETQPTGRIFGEVTTALALHVLLADLVTRIRLSIISS